MKKTILALLALGVFGVANATEADGVPVTAVGTAIPTQRATDNATNAQKTHAKITVTGTVLDNTCEIVSEDRNKPVKLRDVGKNQLTKSGDVAADQLVQIHLENCTVGNAATAGSGTKKVTVAFNSTDKIDHYNNGTLKNLDEVNNVSGHASGVNIQFSNLDGTSIRLGQNDTANALHPITTATGQTHVIEFNARYYATKQSTPGTVKAEAELDLAYE